MDEYSPEHLGRLRDEAQRMVAEVPLYSAYPSPAGGDIEAWLAAQPLIAKKELRRGFPKSLLRRSQDLNAAMRDGLVTMLATSGTTSDRLQVIWEWTWWDPQEREAMRLNTRVAAALARPDYREAVLTTPSCGGGVCHIGDQSVAERTIDGMLFFNQNPDPSYWTDKERARMLAEWIALSPNGIEADPSYLAMLCRSAKKSKTKLPAPEFITLTYELTTAAARRDIARALDAPLYQLYGATEAGVLFMECKSGRLHANARHAHIELLPVENKSGNSERLEKLFRVVVTTLGREWMPLLRYDIGDLVRVSQLISCDCGLKTEGPLLERIEGRLADCTRNGDRLVTPLMIDDAIIASAPLHEQWQIAGDALLVVGEGAASAAAAVSKLLGKQLRGDSTSAIPAEPSGKYRLVRSAA